MTGWLWPLICAVVDHEVVDDVEVVKVMSSSYRRLVNRCARCGARKYDWETWAEGRRYARARGWK